MTTRPDEWYLLCQQHSEQLDTLGREHSLANEKLKRVESKLDSICDAIAELSKTMKVIETATAPITRDPETYEKIRREYYDKQAVEKHFEKTTRKLSGAALFLSVASSIGGLIIWIARK
jgi:predicted nuclease with TOPRIM domain